MRRHPVSDLGNSEQNTVELTSTFSLLVPVSWLWVTPSAYCSACSLVKPRRFCSLWCCGSKFNILQLRPRQGTHVLGLFRLSFVLTSVVHQQVENSKLALQPQLLSPIPPLLRHWFISQRKPLWTVSTFSSSCSYHRHFNNVLRLHFLDQP